MKTRHSVATILIATCLIWQMTSIAVAQLRGYSAKANYAEEQDVSVIQLISDPQKYDGKRVQIIGFLRLEFEGNALYLHREDFEHAISRNGLWIDVPTGMTKNQQDAVNMHYVICVGVFRANRHGHMGMFSGEIDDIQRLQTWDFDRASGGQEQDRPK